MVDVLEHAHGEGFQLSGVALAELGDRAGARGRAEPRVGYRSGSCTWSEAGPQVGTGSCKRPAFFGHMGTPEAFSTEPEFL